MQLKPGLGASYTIRPGNGVCLFYSFQTHPGHLLWKNDNDNDSVFHNDCQWNTPSCVGDMSHLIFRNYIYKIIHLHIENVKSNTNNKLTHFCS